MKPPTYGHFAWVPMKSKVMNGWLDIMDRQVQALPPERTRPALEIFRDINERYEYLPDKRDVWSDITILGAGDCEDFALEYHRQLQMNGYLPTKIWIIIGRLEDGRGHAITVFLGSGDVYLVMDVMNKNTRNTELALWDSYEAKGFTPLIALQAPVTTRPGGNLSWVAGIKQATPKQVA